jgi:hypothetical protein
LVIGLISLFFLNYFHLSHMYNHCTSRLNTLDSKQNKVLYMCYTGLLYNYVAGCLEAKSIAKVEVP